MGVKGAINPAGVGYFTKQDSYKKPQKKSGVIQQGCRQTGFACGNASFGTGPAVARAMINLLVSLLVGQLTGALANTYDGQIYVGAHSHIDSTFKVLEFDAKANKAAVYGFDTPASSAFTSSVVTGETGASRYVFGIVRGNGVYAASLPQSPAHKGVFKEVGAKGEAYMAIAPYDADNVLAAVRGTNELVTLSHSAVAQHKINTYRISPAQYGEINKIVKTGEDRYVAVTDQWVLVLNLANSHAPIEKQFQFKSALDLSSSQSGTVLTIWDVVASKDAAWVRVELSGVSGIYHMAARLDLLKGVEAAFPLDMSNSYAYAGIEPVTGDLYLRINSTLVRMEKSGISAVVRSDFFDAKSVLANYGVNLGTSPFLHFTMRDVALTKADGKAAGDSAAKKVVLDPIEPHEFRKFMEIEQSHSKDLARNSLLKSVVVTAREYATWINQTTTLRYFFKNVRDDLKQHGLRFQVDALVVLPGHENHLVSVAEMLVLLSKGAKAERDMKKCENIVSKP